MGNIKIDEYTKKFTNMLPFLGNILTNEEGRVNQYLNGLLGDYSLEVGNSTTIDEAIEEASRVDDMILNKSSER